VGTLSQTFVRIGDIDTILTELTKYYKIGRQEWHDDRKDWLFNFAPATTIIVSQNFHRDWVELELDIGHNLYLYDEFLRRVSETLNTEILLGYSQTTTGTGRIAKFKKGKMELSYYERHLYFKFHGDNSPAIDRIYVADNWGVLTSPLEELKSAQIGIDGHLIDYDFIYKYFKSEGLEGEPFKAFEDEAYLHLEHIT
jgi:hypothetical protein